MPVKLNPKNMATKTNLIMKNSHGIISMKLNSGKNIEFVKSTVFLRITLEYELRLVVA